MNDPHNDTDDNNDSHNTNTSKESAALARGAARTAAVSSSSSSSSLAAATAAGRSTAAVATRGVMAGRLPISSSTAATSTAATAASSKSIGSSAASATTRVLGRKAQQHLKVPTSRSGTVVGTASRVKVPRAGPPRSTSTPLSSRIPKARADSIAKVSDRASKGLDVLNAGLDISSESREQNNNNRITKSISRIMQQSVAFGKVFITNTILGMAVFSTYEGMIEHLATSSSNIMETSTHNTTNSIVLYPHVTEDCNIDVMDQATVPQHFLAGAMGGAAHALLSLVFDMKFGHPPGDVLSPTSKVTTTFHHPILKLQNLSSKPIHLQLPSVHFSASSIIHHSLAHSTLFGSYQLTKRVFFSQIHNYSSEENDNNSLRYGNNETIRVAAIAVAGGVAGQFQHVISYFSEQWVLNNTSTTSSLLQRVRLSSWPTWRSTVMAFPPSAIGFLAFEFGKLLNTSDGDAYLMSR